VNIERNVVGDDADEVRKPSVALCVAAAVTPTAEKTASPSAARPQGAQAAGLRVCRSRGHPNGGDNCVVVGGAQEDSSNRVGVGSVVNIEPNVVGHGADEEQNLQSP